MYWTIPNKEKYTELFSNIKKAYPEFDVQFMKINHEDAPSTIDVFCESLLVLTVHDIGFVKEMPELKYASSACHRDLPDLKKLLMHELDQLDWFIKGKIW